ncbi:hypothetical protein DFH07DRAFT_780063 [Mycena maculata]|uniref:Uncharacterized protein n=1 Tax=Mycena maculata TaxID=230809 RepID=A0AAD7I523_9AGAR|nr:hypothetical protein DFH07DRAFT_780063 [Mycena maculata]
MSGVRDEFATSPNCKTSIEKMPGVWLPVTRSGKEYSPYQLPKFVTALRALAFDFAPLIARAVAAEGEDRDDREEDDDEAPNEHEAPSKHDAPNEHHASNASNEQNAPNERDPLNDVDDQWLLPPPTDPLDEVDDERPAASPSKKASRSPTFREVVAAAPKPHTSPHRQRPAKPTKAEKVAKAAEKAQKARAAAHARRRSKHACDLAARGHVPAPATVAAVVQPAVPVPTDLNASDLPATFGAYSGKAEGKAEKKGSKVRRSVADLLGLGFHLVKWDGIQPRPLLDKNGQIIAVLAGRPNQDDYLKSATSAFHAIRDAGAAAKFPAAMRNHRRGLFAAVNVGLFYGKGQRVPCWLNNKEHSALVEGLLGNGHIQRLVYFADAAFALWAPRLYNYYMDHDARLQRDSPLCRPFVGSIFSCAAFNLSTNVWTFRHRDVLNLAFGWCTVQALGEFDATEGGHIVLWDLKLVVEFPHSALVLIRSATIAHSNIPVQAGDERLSFTQFTPGGIFRYVDNGCQTVEELAEKDPSKYDQIMALKAARWEMGLSLISTLDELLPNE